MGVARISETPSAIGHSAMATANGTGNLPTRAKRARAIQEAGRCISLSSEPSARPIGGGCGWWMVRK